MTKHYSTTVPGIYKITNTTNNKFYIGSSINITKRWWAHRKNLRLQTHCNSHLQSAWNKYGEEVFLFEVVEEMTKKTMEEVLSKEQEWLDRSYDGGVDCYNMAKIADRPDSTLAKKPIYQLDKDTKEIIKEWDSAADVERELGLGAGCIYNACKGSLITFGGFRWKYMDKELASKFLEKEGRHGGHNKRKVCCLNDGRMFDSVAEAAAEYGVRYTEIIGVAAGRRRHIKGLRFEYVGNEQQLAVSGSIGCFTCLVCNVVFEASRKLATHLQFAHKIKTEDYTVQHLLSGVTPSCHVIGCGNSVRYVSFGFKKYCKEHSNLAESEAGKVGGSAKKPKPVISSSVHCVAFQAQDSFDEYLYGNIELLKVGTELLSPDFLQTLKPEDREQFVEPLFCWFRTHGFPYKLFQEKELRSDYEKLCTRTIGQTNGCLSNKDLSGSKLFWHFQGQNFYSTKTEKQLSMMEAFKNDDTLRAVIRNRLGISYKETFNITGAMLRQGFRSSAACAATSVFNPLVAKFIWEQAPENSIVYDYSMGFGQRMLGALSSDKNFRYVATDPWTKVVEQNKAMSRFLNQEHRVELSTEGAEVFLPAHLVGKVSLAFSSPPYFSKEIYDNGNQKVAKNTEGWFIDTWWTQVVRNIFQLLEPKGLLALNVYDKLYPAMDRVILKEGFRLKHMWYLSLNKSHLTSTAGNSKEKMEPIALYEKVL